MNNNLPAAPRLKSPGLTSCQLALASAHAALAADPPRYPAARSALSRCASVMGWDSLVEWPWRCSLETLPGLYADFADRAVVEDARRQAPKPRRSRIFAVAGWKRVVAS